MRDCIALVDNAARERILELGGIAAIAMSHPRSLARIGAHFDGAAVVT